MEANLFNQSRTTLSAPFVKLFDNRFVANSSSIISRCQRCRNEFSHSYDTPNRFDADQHVRSNRPILLPCGHNMCENCVYHNRSNLTCPICSSTIMIPIDEAKYSNFNVRDFFDMNFFMMGQLHHWRFYCKEGSVFNTTFMSAAGRSLLNSTTHDVDIRAIPTIKCVECEVCPSSGKCRVCKVHYCKRCFDNIHKNSKALRAHTMINTDKKSNLQAELLFLTKPRYCRRHQRGSDRYCKKCDLVCCGECARQDHSGHNFRKLTEANGHLTEELQLAVENTQLAWENLDKAQKDVKSVESQFEEYATKTLEDISNYYVQLHSFLQNEEKQILAKFSEMCHTPQNMIRQTNIKLSEANETINSIRNTLEQYEQIPPENIYLGHILPKYNKIIQQIPSYIEINKPKSNPFLFEVKRDIKADIQNSVYYKYKDPKLNIKIKTPYNESNPPMIDMTTDTVSSILNTKPKRNKKNLKNQQMRSEAFDITDSPTTSNSNATNLVRITNIISPQEFYVQNLNDAEKIRKFSETHLSSELMKIEPASVSEQCSYMVYHVVDKQWYRGQLENNLPNDIYKVYLIDFGVSVQVSKYNLRCGDQKLFIEPGLAIRCSLYDIMPVGKKWTESDNSLLMELVQNKPARASIVAKASETLLKIDLRTDLSKSVRDSFIYSGLAREKPGSHSFKMQPKVKLPILKIEERIPKVNICENEIMMVTALHVEGPNEFYVVKNDFVDRKKQFMAEFNQFYNSNKLKLHQIYLGTVQMCCAVNISGFWYRCVIEEVQDKGQIYVRLVDEGRMEHINWRQAFVLNEMFRNEREFAIHCTLADIEPLQENNYAYTDAALNDFMQMIKNPQLRMEVIEFTSNVCKVVLCVCKNTMDVNIGGMLVKHKYGISSGAATLAAEIARTPRLNISREKVKKMSNDESCTALANVANVNQVKRSLIKVTHLVSPFEFYIQLANLIEGTKTFHQQIQEAQAKKYDSKEPLPYETREWYEDNHCLVYTKCQNSQLVQLCKESLLEHLEWYRGIITKITYLPGEEPTFSVFLRDIGVTVSLINSQQLYSIDPQLDRVTNAVYRCNLACIEPAGGKTWSQSATDSFIYYVMNAETLSVSLYGERIPEQISLAVVLWSSRVETENPLAPCITKYSSINRHLVKKGLAYLSQPLDTKQQFDQIEEMQLENGEITLEQWFKTFSESALFKDEKLLQLQTSENLDDDNETHDVDHQWNKFISEMDFTDTTGEKAPAAWLSPKVITKTIFIGYPTYIDFDCIVYLHEADDKKLLDSITKKLTETYGPMEPPPADARFVLNQACVVKYHVDGKYYRGLITADINADNEWGVTFVDYGNVESVESKDIRPYAPFPKLPALASKYIIDGIRPKGGAPKYNDAELDQMHTLLVTKFVSLSIKLSELEKPVKRCTMRVGAIDVASDFIARGLAEADSEPSGSNKPLTAETSFNLKKLEADAKVFRANKLRKNLNPLPSAPNDDYALFGQIKDMSVDCSFVEEPALGNVDEDNNNLSDSSEDANEDEYLKYDHLNEMLDRLSKNADADQQTARGAPKNAVETSFINATNKPPPKKRLFNENDYTKMMSAMMVYDDRDVFENIDQDFCSDLSRQNEEDEEDDFIELGQSFAMNYWHNGIEEMREEEDDQIKEQLNRRVFSFDDFCESEFDSFHPEDTSTILSHFSGLENFKLPQLPTAMHHFKCRVVFIMTPVILQIFPLHTEFNYRNIELQRTIKEMVQQSLPPLTSFEPRTLCLACYTKDKQWYRAVVRSYNPTGRTVDVLYVDYLNSETLPLKYVRQCPIELLGWPLRTFRVRLHGINANPKIKDTEIRKSLQKVLNKRELFAVVKKHPVCDSMVFGKSLNKTDHIEVVLYESKEASLKEDIKSKCQSMFDAKLRRKLISNKVKVKKKLTDP